MSAVSKSDFGLIQRTLYLLQTVTNESLHCRSTIMNPPRDYPIESPVPDDSGCGLGADQPITFAALLDRHDAELPISDEMIREACVQMDAAQPYPFSAAPSSSWKSRFSIVR